MLQNAFDAAVVGSGHNGLAAAILLAQHGRRVVVYEARDQIGGGARTAELTLPGFFHDMCSAIHPMAAGSFFLSSLPLSEHGLDWVHPTAPLAHPLPGDETALLWTSVEKTAKGLNSVRYQSIIEPLAARWPDLFADAAGPLGVPSNPLLMARFGWHAMQSATSFAERLFSTERGRAFFAGIAAHSLLPLERVPSAAIGLMLSIAGHGPGWPFPKGGAQQIPNAMAAYFRQLGGVIRTGVSIRHIDDVETRGPVLFETAPRHLAAICKDALPERFCNGLRAYRHGPGVFKLDWALDGPIPWQDPAVAQAATVHLGTYDEICQSERAAWQGNRVDRPYVLLAQPSLFDDTRAPEGKHTAWAYCHVPNGSDMDYTEEIEAQVERMAPGFKQMILGRHSMNCTQYEAYNPNFVGGDTVGGANDVMQLFTRPSKRMNPYTTPNPRIFICSAATPPGGGIHGLAGYYAAKSALAKHR